MERTTTGQALGSAGVMAAWTLAEMEMARTAGVSRDFMIAVLTLWAISYLIGFRLGQSISKDVNKWRLPYLLVALLLNVIAIVSWSGVSSWIPYVIASLALGIYTSASTTVTFNLLSSDSWELVLARIKLLSGVAYGLGVISVVAAEASGLLTRSHIVYAITSLIVLIAGFSFRRPALPEVALSQLDASINSIAFGDPHPGASVRDLASVGMLFSLAVLARVFTLKTYQEILGMPTVMVLYALFYSLGAVMGSGLPRPGVIAFAGIVMAVVHVLVDPGRLGGFLELSTSLAFSGFAEAGLILYILRTVPGMLSSATLIITIMFVISSFLSALLLFIGINYDLIIGLLAIVAVAIAYRRVTWT